MPDIFDKVRVKETGDLGMVVAVMSKRQPKPFAVRVMPAAVRAAAGPRCETVYFSEDELELVEVYDPASHLSPPSGGTSGGHAADAVPYRTGVRMPILEPARQPPPQTQLDRIEADGIEMRLTLAIVHAEVNAIARAIERRPTGWQLFWIGLIALFALSAAMEIAGGWS